MKYQKLLLKGILTQNCIFSIDCMLYILSFTLVYKAILYLSLPLEICRYMMHYYWITIKVIW